MLLITLLNRGTAFRTIPKCHFAGEKMYSSHQFCVYMSVTHSCCADLYKDILKMIFLNFCFIFHDTWAWHKNHSIHTQSNNHVQETMLKQSPICLIQQLYHSFLTCDEAGEITVWSSSHYREIHNPHVVDHRFENSCFFKCQCTQQT